MANVVADVYAERTALDKAPGQDSKNRSGSGSAYQNAVAAWRNIDLTSLQKQLDSTASEIVSSQRDSLVERKELAQKTKEFRKMDEEGRAGEWKGLLKSYQSFIDHLTTQKKATETAFMTLYSTLSEAPDPYPLLEATIDSLLSSEDVSKLSSEITSLRTTISRLTSQATHLETRVDEYKRELEKKEREKKEEISKVETVWKGVLDERSRNWEAKEKAFTEKVSDLEGLVRELKASYEVAQRLGRHGASAALDESDDDNRKEDRVGNGLAELEIVARDLERTNLRLAEVEARNEQLRLQLAKATSPPGDSSPPTKESQTGDEDDDPQLIRLQSENTALMRKLELAKSQMEDDKRELERKIKSLERTLEDARKDKEGLKTKLDSWRDYDEVKRELEILKSIEFSTGDDDEDDKDKVLDSSKELVTSQSKLPPSGKKETLEQLLLARNKKLGNELTILRVSHQDLSNRLESLQKALEATTADLRATRELNVKLEEDLSNFQEAPSHPGPAYSVAGTTRYAPSIAHGGYGSVRGGGRVSPTSSIISGFTPQPNTLESLRGSGPGSEIFLGERSGGTGAGAGILPMVTAQRDRFKQRNQQLEDELAKANSTISSLRQETATLQKDNMQLYEKTRYISTYTPSSSRTAAQAGGSPSSSSPSTFVAIGGASGATASAYPNSQGSIIDRYRAAYEANISPFQAFRGRESARAIKRMGLVERVIYGFTRAVLANRLSRNLFVAYCVLLHLLVFGILYWAGTVEVENHGVGLSTGRLGAFSGRGGGNRIDEDPLAWRKDTLSVR